MDRRRLLALGASVGALSAAGALYGLSRARPARDRWPSVGSGTRAHVGSERRVVVVGGGLAGIAAAAALAARGYTVDLYEQSDALGGKVGGWPVSVDGVSMPMEHGFHGFFNQYYNLLDLLGEAGATDALAPVDGYQVLVRDRPSEVFGHSVLPFPLDLLEIVGRSPGIDLADVAGDRPGMDALLAYDPVRTFAALDGTDLDTFIRESRLDGPFADIVLRPFGQASMNALSGFSAAEAVRFFHFYMLGNPEGLGFSALRRGSGISVVAPLTAHLERLGVRVHLSTPVRRIALQEGRAVGIVVGGEAAVPEVEVAIADLPAEGWHPVGETFIRRTGEGFEARSSRCTHMGCPVALAVGGFACPCHAGRYDAEGRPIAGPPPRPLDRLEVEVQGDRLAVRSAPGVAETLVRADAVVIATEVRGLQALARASELSAHAPALAADIASQGEADPYSVVRLWFDRPLSPGRPAFLTVAGYPWTDGLAAYSGFQHGARAWSERTGGSVVETHAYAIPPEQQGSLERYRDGLRTELVSIFPELRDAKVVHEEAMTQSNFTRFAPGDAARRPSVATSVPNLFLAGDHVQLGFPAFLMEAAVASGRLAANHICAADGVREIPIPTVAQRGVLA